MNWTGAYDSRFLVGDWTGLLEEHDRWMHDYNVQDPAYGTAQAHRRYAHVLEDMREDAARAMDELF